MDVNVVKCRKILLTVNTLADPTAILRFSFPPVSMLHIYSTAIKQLLVT